MTELVHASSGTNEEHYIKEQSYEKKAAYLRGKGDYRRLVKMNMADYKFKFKLEEFPAFIKEQRLAKKMTQVQFAEYIGITDRMLGHWETGYRLPNMEDLISTLRKIGYELEIRKVAEDE